MAAETVAMHPDVAVIATMLGAWSTGGFEAATFDASYDKYVSQAYVASYEPASPHPMLAQHFYGKVGFKVWIDLVANHTFTTFVPRMSSIGGGEVLMHLEVGSHSKLTGAAVPPYCIMAMIKIADGKIAKWTWYGEKADGWNQIFGTKA